LYQLQKRLIYGTGDILRRQMHSSNFFNANYHTEELWKGEPKTGTH
jgi:hypothetical protein